MQSYRCRNPDWWRCSQAAPWRVQRSLKAMKTSDLLWLNLSLVILGMHLRLSIVMLFALFVGMSSTWACRLTARLWPTPYAICSKLTPH
jgi:hypothetical protein